jgi:hypothetical protein
MLAADMTNVTAKPSMILVRKRNVGIAKDRSPTGIDISLPNDFGNARKFSVFPRPDAKDATELIET